MSKIEGRQTEELVKMTRSCARNELVKAIVVDFDCRGVFFMAFDLNWTYLCELLTQKKSVDPFLIARVSVE